MIEYLKGDATKPCVEDGLRVITHIVNDEGKWGSGFVVALSDRWEEPEDYYRNQFKQAKYGKAEFELGKIQWTFVDIDLAVCNMIAQHGLKKAKDEVPLRYESLETCLEKMAVGARAAAGISDKSSLEKKRLSIHMPRIGCDRGGGKWERVEAIIEETCWDLEVYVYDLK